MGAAEQAAQTSAVADSPTVAEASAVTETSSVAVTYTHVEALPPAHVPPVLQSSIVTNETPLGDSVPCVLVGGVADPSEVALEGGVAKACHTSAEKPEDALKHDDSAKRQGLE